MSQQIQGISPEGHQSLIQSEKAQHNASIFTSTYVPYLGMALKGDHSNSYFGMENAGMYYANQALATIKQGLVIGDTFTASKNDPDSDYKRQNFNVSPKVQVEFVASLKKKFWVEAQNRKAQQEFI